MFLFLFASVFICLLSSEIHYNYHSAIIINHNNHSAKSKRKNLRKSLHNESNFKFILLYCFRSIQNHPKREKLLEKYCIHSLKSHNQQASAYEKQGHVTIARLVSKFRGCRQVKSRTQSTKKACGGMR